jgi:hypothetical protein
MISTSITDTSLVEWGGVPGSEGAAWAYPGSDYKPWRVYVVEALATVSRLVTCCASYLAVDTFLNSNSSLFAHASPGNRLTSTASASSAQVDNKYIRSSPTFVEGVIAFITLIPKRGAGIARRI